MKKLVLMAFVLLAFAMPAKADQTLPSAPAQAIPEDMLQKDYQACMGGFTAQQDPQRAEYCQCVHDKLKSWSLQTYGDTAQQMQKSGSDISSLPAQVQQIAQACIQQVGH